MSMDDLDELMSYFDDFEIDLDLVERYTDFNSIPKVEHQYFFETDGDELPRIIGENPDSFFVAIPYCAKPENCPEERDSDRCTPDCEVDCQLKEIHILTKKLGSDFFIIRSDDEYIQYMIHKKEKIKEGTLYQLTWGCPMTIKAFLPVVAGIGTRGIGMELTGPVCDKSSDYTHSIKNIKRKRTFLGGIDTAKLYLKKAIEIKEQRHIELDILVDTEISSTAKV